MNYQLRAKRGATTCRSSLEDAAQLGPASDVSERGSKSRGGVRMPRRL